MDTYKIINSKDSGLAINLLFKEDLELSMYEKMLMVHHWTLLGKPEVFETRLIEVLGFEWDTYMNPFLIKLYNLPFINLLAERDNFESLEDPEYKGILEMIFLKKLENLENEQSIGGYVSEVLEHKHSQRKQSLVLNITSRDKRYELFNFSAAVEGYSFLPSIRLFNRPENLNHLLTEQSITDLKGIIYTMTENPNWDKSLLPLSLKYLKFESSILDEMSKAIIKKYYTLEFQSKFVNPEDLIDEEEDEDPEFEM